MNENKSTNDLAFLNIIRFILAFCVMFMHFCGYMNIAARSSMWAIFPYSIGSIATTGFFVISGMLFYRVYYHKLVSDKMSFTDFLIRRWKKIFPLVLITTIMLMSINAISMRINNACHSNTFKFSDFVIAITTFGTVLFDNNFHMNGNWYLSVLFFVYLLMIIACYFFKKTKNKIYFFIPFVLGVFMGFSKIQFPFCNDKIAIGLFSFMIGFYLDCFLSKIANATKLIITLKIICSLCLITLFVFLIKDKFNNALTNNYWSLTSSILLYCPLFVLLNNVGKNVFSWKVFKILGGCSFDVYMWHQTVYSIFFLILYKEKIDFSKSYYWLIIIILSTLAFSILSFLVIDKNIVKLPLQIKTAFLDIKTRKFKK